MRQNDEAVSVEETGAGLFQSRVRSRGTAFFADEPVAIGGLASGPDPFELVGAGLAACTVMTMRLYARRKGWRVGRMSAKVHHSRRSGGSRNRFDLQIRIEPGLGDEERARLLDIARRCPVHRLLEPGADIVIQLDQADLSPAAGAAAGTINA
jgi:putative redox protein